MDSQSASASHPRAIVPGRFTRVSAQTPAGEIEARLSEQGNWEVRVRRDQQMVWQHACSGDMDCGAIVSQTLGDLSEEIITVGSLTIDSAAQRVTVNDVPVHLKPKEFALLVLLATHPDRVFSRQEIIATAWGGRSPGHHRTLNAHVSRVRRALSSAGAPGLLVNSRGYGYRLRARPDLARLSPSTPSGRGGSS